MGEKRGQEKRARRAKEKQKEKRKQKAMSLYSRREVKAPGVQGGEVSRSDTKSPVASAFFLTAVTDVLRALSAHGFGEEGENLFLDDLATNETERPVFITFRLVDMGSRVGGLYFVYYLQANGDIFCCGIGRSKELIKASLLQEWPIPPNVQQDHTRALAETLLSPWVRDERPKDTLFQRENRPQEPSCLQLLQGISEGKHLVLY
jgi:hypothetical protein